MSILLLADGERYSPVARIGQFHPLRKVNWTRNEPPPAAGGADDAPSRFRGYLACGKMGQRDVSDEWRECECGKNLKNLPCAAT